MVTTRSQDRKLEESELPVRPRTEGIVSSPILKRSRTAVDNEAAIKRLKIDRRNSADIGQTFQNTGPSNKAAHQVIDAASQSDKAVTTLDTSHLPNEASLGTEEPSCATAELPRTSAGEVNSDQQRIEPMPQEPPKAAGDTNGPAIPTNGRPDSPTLNQKVNDQPMPEPSRVDKRIGSEDLESYDFVTPETSRKKDVSERSTIPSHPLTMPLPFNSRELPRQKHIHQYVAEAPAPGPLPPPAKMPRRYSNLKRSTLSSPSTPTSSISRYRQTMLGRHKRTTYWAGRKPKFAGVTAR